MRSADRAGAIASVPYQQLGPPGWSLEKLPTVADVHRAVRAHGCDFLAEPGKDRVGAERPRDHHDVRTTERLT
jgi:hypothetical protein